MRPARPIAGLSGSAQERFEERIIPEPNSGCWLWTGSIDRHGYGRFRLVPCGPYWRAHRVSIAIYAPDAQIGGRWILHSCDVKSCVNPDHLRIGDKDGNTADMMARRGGTSGPLPRGVKVLRSGRFAAQASQRGRNLHLGTFNTPKEAHEAAEQWRAARIRRLRKAVGWEVSHG